VLHQYPGDEEFRAVDCPTSIPTSCECRDGDGDDDCFDDTPSAAPSHADISWSTDFAHPLGSLIHVALSKNAREGGGCGGGV
jgi:hypothetical protein